jgi:ribulose-phosphate 3-epimerase
MIEAPERFLADFAQGGATIVSVHIETCPHLHRTVEHIRELGMRPSVTLNPATSLQNLWEILPYVEQVLVMTVNPGFGGQSYIPTMTEKIAALRIMIAERNPDVEIEVDGGIEADVVHEVLGAGARVLVAGTAIFRHPHGIAAGIAALRKAADSRS